MSHSLPGYAPRLDALHRALADDFRAIVARLPLEGDETVVDAGCGSGFFTGLLAERVPRGQCIAVDKAPAFIRVAESRLAAPIAAGRCRVVQGDVARLPFDAGQIDMVWSAHSMQSYPSIPHALDEFRRVLRPGGLIAVLETDNVHSIMLSWPPDLELAVRRAEHRDIGDEDSYIGTYFPRFAPRLCRDAGLEDFRREYVFIARQGPPSPDLERYVELYVTHLADSLAGRLSAGADRRLRALANPAGAEFLARQDNFFFGSLQVLMTARRPLTAAAGTGKK